MALPETKPMRCARRAKLYLSQQDLASAAQCSLSAVRSWENGELAQYSKVKRRIEAALERAERKVS